MDEKRQKNILIVDDDKDLVLSMSMLLKSKGYSVLAAFEGIYAVNMAKNENVDLIILDISMPAGNGFFVLKALRNLTRTCITPIIVLTAQQDDGLKEKVISLGANDYMQKPFDPSEFLNKIKGIIGD